VTAMPYFVVLIVATPFVFTGWLINRIFEHRLQVKQLEAGSPAQAALGPAQSDETSRRLANLEAVISSLDYDLAERLRSQDATKAA